MTDQDPRSSTGAVSARGAEHPRSAPAGGLAGDESLPDLLRQLSEQTATLVRQEMELAKAELSVKGKRLGVGAGAFGGAGLVGLFALGALTACLILALDIAVAGWLAALIVAVIYAAVAGVAALVGRRKVQQGSPPLPERAIESTKEDLEWTKSRVRQTRA